MFWSFRENLGNARHLLHALGRVVLRRPPTLFFEKLVIRSDRIKLVVDDSGKPLTCKTCGYARARLVLPGEWEVESCTAVGLDGLIDNEKLDAWAASLPRLVATETRQSVKCK